MIPKIIHYCHFGDKPLSELTLKCIKSWKKYCPDYEIVAWNEQNFDVNALPYISALYKEKKYAHVSDYARLKIIYENGGIYLDTDVELVSSLDGFLEEKAFFAMQEAGKVATGLGFGAEAKSEILSALMKGYENKNYSGGEKIITETCVDTDEKVFKALGLKDKDILQVLPGVTVYPSEYFNPKNFETGKMQITENTVSIHHYDSSWYDETEKIIHRTLREMIERYGEEEAKIHFGKWYKRNRIRLTLKRYGIVGIIKKLISGR